MVVHFVTNSFVSRVPSEFILVRRRFPRYPFFQHFLRVSPLPLNRISYHQVHLWLLSFQIRKQLKLRKCSIKSSLTTFLFRLVFTVMFRIFRYFRCSLDYFNVRVCKLIALVMNSSGKWKVRQMFSNLYPMGLTTLFVHVSVALCLKQQIHVPEYSKILNCGVHRTWFSAQKVSVFLLDSRSCNNNIWILKEKNTYTLNIWRRDLVRILNSSS